MTACSRLATGLLTGTLLTGLLAAPAAAALPAAAPAAAARPAADTSELQSLLDQMVAAGATGALARVDDGTAVRGYASGTVRLGSGIPVTPGARFRVGSVTKSFTATVVLQLVGAGRLRLSDPVSRWLPGLVPNGEQITVRMLLNHTSGLYDYGSDEAFGATLGTDPRHVWTHRQLVRIGTAHEPYFAPGTGWYYSNTNYIVAGLIVEKVTGRTLQTEIERRILAPLKLEQTSFPNFSPYIRGYHTHGYYPPSLTGGAGYVDFTALSPTATWAAGAVVSTAADISRFYSALLGGTLLRPAQLRAMQTRVAVSATIGYGLGIFSVRTPCGTVWGHNGNVPGYVTQAFSDRAGTRSFVINMSTAPDERTGPLFGTAGAVAACSMLGTSPRRAVTPPWGTAGMRARF